MINGKSQITVSRHLGVVAFSTKIYYKFTVVFEYAVKKIKTSQHLAKLQARKLIVSRTLCAGALSW